MNSPQADGSGNWAGLVGAGSTFGAVSATWTVPAVQPSNEEKSSATWIGIDGVSNTDLIQTGTMQEVGPGGTTYFAWYEILPQPAQPLGIVSPGDTIQATIEQVSAGTWAVDIQDSSSGQHASGDLPYSGPATSAEWIEEAPSDAAGNIQPLADFGTVHLSNVHGAAQDPNAVSQSPVVMVDGAGNIIAYPTNASSNAFDVVYGSPPGNTTTSSTTSLVNSSTTAAPGGAKTVTRLAGTGRDQTAVMVSRDSYPLGSPGASAAVLANDSSFADALAGTPLAAAKGGPLLLTGRDTLSPDASAELQRVLPRGATVYLLGGGFALSDTVASQVTGLGFNVVRYAGENRFATAAIIADQGLGNPSTVLEANGLDFADALSAGAAAAKANGAVLLTAGSSEAPETANYISAHTADTRYAVGGPAAAADPAARALVGTDRYQTSTLVASTFFSSPTAVGIADGLNFPDALSGGVHIEHRDGPIVLTDPNSLPASTQNYLSANTLTIRLAYIYGGGYAVSAGVQSSVTSALGAAAGSTTTTTTPPS